MPVNTAKIASDTNNIALNLKGCPTIPKKLPSGVIKLTFD